MNTLDFVTQNSRARILISLQFYLVVVSAALACREGTKPEKQESSKPQASVLCSSRDFFFFSRALREGGTLS